MVMVVLWLGLFSGAGCCVAGIYSVWLWLCYFVHCGLWLCSCSVVVAMLLHSLCLFAAWLRLGLYLFYGCCVLVGLLCLGRLCTGGLSSGP